MNAKVTMRSGDIFLTEIDLAREPIASITERMTPGGYIVIHDERWGGKRILILQLSEVESIVLTDGGDADEMVDLVVPGDAPVGGAGAKGVQK